MIAWIEEITFFFVFLFTLWNLCALLHVGYRKKLAARPHFFFYSSSHQVKKKLRKILFTCVHPPVSTKFQSFSFIQNPISVKLIPFSGEHNPQMLLPILCLKTAAWSLTKLLERYTEIWLRKLLYRFTNKHFDFKHVKFLPADFGS